MLVHLITVDTGWSEPPRVALVATIGVTFVAAYVATLAARGRVAVIRPY